MSELATMIKDMTKKPDTPGYTTFMGHKVADMDREDLIACVEWCMSEIKWRDAKENDRLSRSIEALRR